jgi:hypothetical protein
LFGASFLLSALMGAPRADHFLHARLHLP